MNSQIEIIDSQNDIERLHMLYLVTLKCQLF
jgi:hypothetical protein